MLLFFLTIDKAVDFYSQKCTTLALNVKLRDDLFVKEDYVKGKKEQKNTMRKDGEWEED